MGREYSAPVIMDGGAMSSTYLSLALTLVDAEIADTISSGSGLLTEAIIAVAQNMSFFRCGLQPGRRSQARCGEYSCRPDVPGMEWNPASEHRIHEKGITEILLFAALRCSQPSVCASVI